MKSYKISEQEAGVRLDKFVQQKAPLLPSGLMHKYFRLKRFKVDNRRGLPSQKLGAAQLVQLYINDEFFLKINNSLPFLKYPATVDVVFEDKNIIIMNKPAGLLTQSETEDNLEYRMRHYLHKTGGYDPKVHRFLPSLAHRIDRNTSGIIIAAKNHKSLEILNEKLKAHEISKFYLCLAHGIIEPPSATIKAYLKKNQRLKRVFIYDNPLPDTKEIITKYDVLASCHDKSLLEVELITGRTHQIRAHMAYIDHPLLGEGKYAKNAEDKRLGFKHQALCSYKIRFDFTTDAELLNYLNGKEFKLDNVWFKDKFERGFSQ